MVDDLHPCGAYKYLCCSRGSDAIFHSETLCPYGYSDDSKLDRIVDARGMACPLPVVNAKQAVEEMKAGEILDVLVDNEIAVQNLTRFSMDVQAG